MAWATGFVVYLFIYWFLCIHDRQKQLPWAPATQNLSGTRKFFFVVLCFSYIHIPFVFLFLTFFFFYVLCFFFVPCSSNGWMAPGFDFWCKVCSVFLRRPGGMCGGLVHVYHYYNNWCWRVRMWCCLCLSCVCCCYLWLAVVKWLAHCCEARCICFGRDYWTVIDWLVGLRCCYGSFAKNYTWILSQKPSTSPSLFCRLLKRLFFLYEAIFNCEKEETVYTHYYYSDRPS